MPAVGVSGNKKALRLNHAEEDRRRRFKGKNPGWGDAIAGVGIETLPLGLRLICAHRRTARCGELQRMQPDTTQQQGQHGQADD